MNSYLSEANFVEDLKHSGQQREQISQITSYLVKNRPLTFEECVVWARMQFEEKFSNEIRQLLFSLPKDAVTSSGQPFWSGPKRAPDPLTFDPEDVSFLLTERSNILTQYLAHPSWFHNCSFKPTCLQLWPPWRNRYNYLQEGGKLC